MSAFIGFAIVLAIVVVAVVLVLRATKRSRRRDAPGRGGSQSDTAQTDDATGYVTGVWMLGGAESAAPSEHTHGHHHGADAAGAHAADPSGGHAGGSHGGGGH
jgi:ABC-type nickel/cobalt efflux system permease component RcnA